MRFGSDIPFLKHPSCENEACEGGLIWTDKGLRPCPCLKLVASEVRMRKCRLPKHLADKAVKDYKGHTASQKLAKIACVGWVKTYTPTSESLYLWGSVGAGKSHLAAACLRAAIGQHAAIGRYACWPDTLVTARRRFDESDLDDPIEPLIDAELLVIDDVGYRDGAGGATEYERETLYRIAEERQLVPTIWTSNLSPDRLEQVYNDRIASRILGPARVIEITGPDGRKAGKA